MKKTYKLLICIALAFTIFTTAYTVSFAEEADGSSIGGSAEITDTGAGVTGDTTENEEADAALGSADADADGSLTVGDGITESVFEILFNKVKEYSSEIFCALTFICSMILTVAYKKKLFPFLQSSLASLGAILSGMKEGAEKSNAETKDIDSSILKRIDETEKAVSKLAELIDTMTQALADSKIDEQERRDMKAVIEAEVDLLYEIFMSSSLPEYKKESVAQKINKIKDGYSRDALE